MNKAVFIVLAAVFIASALLLAVLFSFDPGPKATFHLKPDENTVLFAITPWGEPRQAREAYMPLLDHLSKKTGKKFQPLVMEGYDVAIENISDGNLDIAVIPPVSFVRAKEMEPGIKYISTIERRDGNRTYTTYKAYLIALSSKYKGWKIDDFLKDPKKFSIAFVTNASSSGWAYPMAMFKKRGVEPSSAFKEVKSFDDHPSVTNAIAKGQIDLGATWEYNLEQAVKKHGDIFEIIEVTGNIPGLLWVASKNVRPELIEQIKKIQAEINSDPELKKELLKDTPDKGWAFLNESFYDEVREVLKYVGDFH